MAGLTPIAGPRAFHALLVSVYEMGRQPFGVASPAAWLRDAGIDVTCVDLAVDQLPETSVRGADLIAFYVPMHTATRIAAQTIAHVRRINPHAHLCVYGLYAPMNADYLRGLGADTIIGGEFEEPLAELADTLRRGPDAALKTKGRPTVVSLDRLHFRVPDRSGLPPLSSYACVQLPAGGYRVAGYTESTRGCKHLCRHCPIVPVYGGRFRVVQREIVLEDIAQQVAAGAAHITFGDPDFFNGPAHAVGVVQELHQRFPDVTYDVTIKIEHLLDQAHRLPILRDTGCLLVTSAVEALDDHVLERFDKRHTRQDFLDTVRLLRQTGLALNPTFVAFTPWTSLDMYGDFLLTLHELELVGNVAPVQYAIRLLIPQGSRLLELDDVRRLIGEFDPAALCYRWEHPDPRVDALQQRIFELVQRSLSQPREEIFRGVCQAAADSVNAELRVRLLELDHGPPRERIPYLTEPWFC